MGALSEVPRQAIAHTVEAVGYTDCISAEE